METVCEVPFKLMSRQEAKKAEPILREYLLRSSDKVVMQRMGSSAVSWFHIWPYYFGMQKFKKMLKPGDLAWENDHEWAFNLTENIKSYLNQATLLYTGRGKIFYGLSDLKFIKQENVLAQFISGEKLLILHISDSDKVELANQGVYMDSPEM